MAKKSRASTGSAAAAVATASPKSKAKSQTTYNGFVALPLSVSSPVPIASSSKSPEHYLFVRAHTPKASAGEGERERAQRTLFVANVPVDLGERALRTLFGKWGVVEDVVLPEVVGDALEAAVRGLPDSDDEDDEDEGEGEGEDEAAAEDDGWTTVGKNGEFLGTGEKAPRSRRTRRKVAELPASVPTVVPLPDLSPRGTSFGVSGGRVAHVVFLDAVSVPRVLSYAGTALPGDKSAEPTGLAFFEAQYDALRPSLVAVREHADSAMARYDHLHSLLLSSRARKHGAGALVDEDGFTVVVRGGRYGRTAGRGGDPGGAGVGVAAREFAKSAASKTKGKGAGELTDFYKFQAVDRKRQGGLASVSIADGRTRRHARALCRRPEEGRGAQEVAPLQALLDAARSVLGIVPMHVIGIVVLSWAGLGLSSSFGTVYRVAAACHRQALSCPLQPATAHFFSLASSVSFFSASLARWSACSIARATSTTSASLSSNSATREGICALVTMRPG